MRLGGDDVDNLIADDMGAQFLETHRYDTRQAVVSGLAWDECVSFFIDRAGDDRGAASEHGVEGSAGVLRENRVGRSTAHLEDRPGHSNLAARSVTIAQVWRMT